MQVQQQTQLPRRSSPHYTTRHRHHLPGRGYTSWSEGVVDGRHHHSVDGTEGTTFVADSVGSPVHRHAVSILTAHRMEHGYTSGPTTDGTVVPALGWIGRVLRR
jgi:hypothetical protein